MDKWKAAFGAARPRFIRDNVEHDGITYARMTDPVLGVTLQADAAHASLLPWLFRSQWIQLARERDTVKA